MPWSPPPQFKQDNIISAQAHLNTLVNDIDFLYGAVYTNRVGCTSYQWREGFSHIDGLDRIWIGYGRKIQNTINVAVSYSTETAITQRIRINREDGTRFSDKTTPIPAFTSGVVTTPVDVTDIPVDEFYKVMVDVVRDSAPGGGNGTTVVYVLSVWESGVGTYTPLNPFNSGKPLTADWNNLSETATMAYKQAMNIAGCFSGFRWEPNKGSDADTDFRTGIFHMNDILYVDMQMKEPDNLETYNDFFATLVINGSTDLYAIGFTTTAIGSFTGYDDTVIPVTNANHFVANQLVFIGGWREAGNREVCKIVSVDRGSDPQTITVDRYQDGGTKVPQRWDAGKTVGHFQQTVALPEDEGDLSMHRFRLSYYDMDSLGLSLNELYEFSIRTSYLEIHDPGYPDSENAGEVSVTAVYEIPQSVIPPSNYQPMVKYERGTLVAGAASLANISQNLTWLSENVEYRSVLTSKHWDVLPADVSAIDDYIKESKPLNMGRRYDWLWYYIEEEDTSPQIVYFNGNEWVEIGLDSELDVWHFADLTDYPGLWPGTQYMIYGVNFAMESERVYNAEV